MTIKNQLQEIESLSDFNFLNQIVLKKINSILQASTKKQACAHEYLRAIFEVRTKPSNRHLSSLFSQMKKGINPKILSADRIYRLRELTLIALRCIDKDSREFDSKVYEDYLAIFQKQKTFSKSLTKQEFNRTATRIAIVGTARSGSSLLASYIRSIPNTRYLSEILNYKHKTGLQLKNWSYKAALSHVRRAYSSFNESIVFAKFLHYQLKGARVSLKDLKKIVPEVKFIFICRENLLAQFVSAKVASLTKDYIWNGIEFEGKIKIDKKELVQFCKVTQNFYDEILSSHLLTKNNHSIVTYEELCENPNVVWNRSIFPLLNIEAQSLTTTLVKQINRPLKDIIDNYSEVIDEIGHFRLKLGFSKQL